MQDLIADPSSHAGYELKAQRLYYKDRLVLPQNSARIPIILKEFHSSALGGHAGYFRTFKRISNIVYWVGMRAAIKDFVAACEICQRNKHSTLSAAGLLQPLPVPSTIWSDISLDFIGGLPKSKGKDTILVVVDRFTKYAHFLALSHPYTASEVAALFIQEIVRLHGFPRTIVSDRDPLFLSNFWKALFKAAGTQLNYSSAYHPQSDGQTEVVNRCLEAYLRCLSGTRPKQWLSCLAWAEFWFNTNYNASSHMTPFKALYGLDPPTLLGDAVIPSRMEEVSQLVAQRDELLTDLRENLLKSQDFMRKHANKHRREVVFAENDWVFLKLQPYRLKSLAKKVNEKLSPRFYGPFKVLARVGEVAYRLDLPPTSKVHPVFHVSLLKKVVGPQCQPQPLPEMLSAEQELLVWPDKLLELRDSSAGGIEVLVQWKNLPTCENSWESVQRMQEAFPSYHLEDKVKLLAPGIDRIKPPITKVYHRRPKE